MFTFYLLGILDNVSRTVSMLGGSIIIKPMIELCAKPIGVCKDCKKPLYENSDIGGSIIHSWEKTEGWIELLCTICATKRALSEYIVR